jgi:hypothetical protein
MAEKNVSGPPVPTAKSPKPVSEALLNEKVRSNYENVSRVDRQCKRNDHTFEAVGNGRSRKVPGTELGVAARDSCTVDDYAGR